MGEGEVWRVTCKQCGASSAMDVVDTDALVCGCCTQAHSHEAAANACPSSHAHDGTPCGPGAAGCQVCRPVEISLLIPVKVG
jgi:hypothetical protein